MLRRLSSGGGATEVWEGRAPDGELVALKLLGPGAAAREDLRIRFATEGELLRRYGGSHHLLRCDGVIDDPPCLVLEPAELGSLRDRLTLSVLPLRLAIPVVVHAADALSWLHRHQVIHRDVKPSNLLLTSDATWRLGDLGVAAQGDPPRGLPAGWTEEEIGTPGYAAPELLRDPALASVATDVYGLGAVLYECLSGKLPVEMEEGESEEEYRVRAAGGPAPTPLDRHIQFPAMLIDPVMRAIAPNPRDRFGTVAEFAGRVARLG